MPSLRSSLFITFLASNGAMAIQMIVTIVLARLLSPSEIGVFSITAVLVYIAHIFRDFGVTSYLQREKDLTRDKVATAFGVLIASSWAIALLIYLLAPLAAGFYGQPGVKDVMQVLALGFVFIPLGSITNSLLTRDYKAREQAYANAAGTVAYAITAIGLAYMGHSYMSMAWANLANVIATGIALIPFRPANAPWWPSLRGWRHVVGFGSGAVLSNSLAMVNNAIPDVVLGKLSGTHDVGIMSRAVSTTSMLGMLLGPTVNYAALPYLSREHHANHSLQEPMARAVAYVTCIMWPAFAVIAVHADAIVLLLYGEQWIESIPLVQIMCLATMTTTPFTFTNSAYMAIGRPYLTSAPTLVLVALKGLLIYWFYNGALATFAVALAVAGVLVVPMNIVMQQVFLGFRWVTFLQSLWRSLIVTILCFGASLFWLTPAVALPPLPKLAAVGISTGMTWLMAVIVLRHPLSHELMRIYGRFRGRP